MLNRHPPFILKKRGTVSVGLKSCPLINFWPFAWVSCKSRYSGCFWRGLDDPYWFSDQRSKSNLCSSSIIDALVTHCLIVKKLGRVAGTRNKAIPFHFRLCCDLHSKHCSLMTSLLGTTIYSRLKVKVKLMVLNTQDLMTSLLGADLT